MDQNNALKFDENNHLIVQSTAIGDYKKVVQIAQDCSNLQIQIKNTIRTMQIIFLRKLKKIK